MTDTEEAICRVCLAKMESDHEALDEAKKKCLFNVLLELNLSVSENPVVCKRCARDMEHAADFKKTCLQTEEIISAFVALSDDVTLDLRDIYLSENADSNLQADEDWVCRLCLTCMKKDSCLSLDILKENIRVVRDMLPKCLPELDFSLTSEPVVCTSCIRSMERYFTFSKVCLEVEQKIENYYRDVKITTTDKIRLGDLVQFIMDHLMGNSNVGSMENGQRAQQMKKTNSNEITKSSKNKRPRANKSKPNREVKKLRTGPKTSQKPTPTTKPARTESDCVPGKSTGNTTAYKCQLCSYETNTADQLRTHETAQHQPKRYKCKLCPFEANRKNHLAVHCLSHDPKRRYLCDLCSYETRRKNLLLVHVKVHRETKEELLKCVLCPYESKVKSAFKRHMENHLKVTVKPNAVAQDLMIIKEGGNLRLVRKNDTK